MGSAPTITIYVPGPLRTYCAGATELSMSAHTVRAALEDLERSQSDLIAMSVTKRVRYAAPERVCESDNVRDLNGVDTTLAPGDVVTILPAVSGG